MAFTTILARLGVNLTLDTAAFETGSRKAQREVKGLEGAMQKAGKVIAVAGGALLAAGVFEEIKRLTTAGLEYASSLGETAQQLGVTAKELQEYRYVASQVGIEQDQMDKGLQRLSITLGQLASGADKPREALEQLGFTAGEIEEISRMTAGDALPKLADAFAKIESPTQRASLAAELFGAKMGPRFLSLLEGGAEGINGLRDAAHELGIVLSDQQIQNADETADKMAQLKQVLEARIAGVVADNAQSIYALVDALAALATAAIEAAGSWLTWNNALNERDRRRSLATARLRQDPRVNDANRAAITQRTFELIDRDLGVREQTVAGGPFGLFNVKRVTVDPRKPAAAARPSAPGALQGDIPARSSGGSRGSGSGAAARARAERDEAGALADAAEDAAIRANAAALGISGTFETMSDETRAALRRVFPELDRLIEYQEQLAALGGNAGARTADGFSAESLLRSSMLGTGALRNPWDIPDFGGRELLTKGLEETETALGKFLDRVKLTNVRVAKSFKDMADDTLSSLSRLRGGIESGDFLSILEGLLGFGLQLGSIGVFGKSIQTNLNRVPGYAGGTGFHPGGLALVGERGAELVDLPRGARVSTHAESRRMMGAVVEIVDTTGLFVTRVNGQIASAAPAIAKVGGAIGVAKVRRARSRMLALEA